MTTTRATMTITITTALPPFSLHQSILTQMSKGSLMPRETSLDTMGQPTLTMATQMSANGSSGPNPRTSQVTSPDGMIARQACLVSAPTIDLTAILHAEQVKPSEHETADDGVAIA